jgi:cation diffusion facilitator CzcD-associated flavoprotein CzcO
MFRGLDKRFGRHSVEDIDFDALRGKTVGVIGAGASGVDNAAESLEHGAARVAMLVRRPDVPRINKGMGIGSAGFWVGFHALTHAQKWSIVNYIDEQAVPPPRDSMLRVTAQQEFLHLCALHADGRRDQGWPCPARHHARQAGIRFSHPGDRPHRRLEPAPGVRRAEGPHVSSGAITSCRRATRLRQADHPFVGPAFEFLERTPGTAPWVSRIHCFTFPGLSEPWSDLGRHSGDQHRAERVADGVASRAVRRGLRADVAAHGRLEQSGTARRRIRARRGRVAVPRRPAGERET